MSNNSLDRDLLYGAIAFQKKYIDHQTLSKAVHAWSNDGSLALSDILQESYGVSAGQHEQITEALDEQLFSDESFSSQLHPLLDKDETSDPDTAGEGVSTQNPPSQLPKLPTPPMPPPTTKAPEVGSRFRILRHHADGGLGRVNIALDQQLHREVALKEIRPDHAHSEERKQRFAFEAEVTGRLEHPGVAPVYGVGRYDDGRLYYAMRFIHGETLRSAILQHFQRMRLQTTSQKELAQRQLLSRFVSVCHTIHFAHSRGVLHRDLKPDNIMLGEYGETLVVDWGLARVLDGDDTDSDGATYLKPVGDFDQTVHGHAHGTPGYMSPEQAQGKTAELAPPTDIYGLGATLFSLLTGEPPFREKTTDATLAKVLTGDFEPPRKRRPEIPRMLEAICLKAMQLDPASRYATAADLARDIECFLADEPIAAREDTLIEILNRCSRRHRTAVLATTAAMLLVTCFSILGVGYLNHQRLRADRYAQGEHKARVEQKSQLQEALLQQAQATQLAGGRGSRDKALSVLDNAISLQDAEAPHNPQIRDVMIQTLVGWDVEQVQERTLPDPATTIVGASNGQYIVAGEATITCYAAGGDQVWSLTEEGALFQSLVLAPTKDQILTWSDDGTVLVLNAATGKVAARFLAHKENVVSAAFGPSNHYVSTTDGNRLHVWRILDGQLAFEDECPGTDGEDSTAHLAASVPSDFVMVAQPDGMAYIWRIDQGDWARSEYFFGQTVDNLVTSADGSTVLAICGENVPPPPPPLPPVEEPFFPSPESPLPPEAPAPRVPQAPQPPSSSGSAQSRVPQFDRDGYSFVLQEEPVSPVEPDSPTVSPQSNPVQASSLSSDAAKFTIGSFASTQAHTQRLDLVAIRIDNIGNVATIDVEPLPWWLGETSVFVVARQSAEILLANETGSVAVFTLAGGELRERYSFSPEHTRITACGVCDDGSQVHVLSSENSLSTWSLQGESVRSLLRRVSRDDPPVRFGRLSCRNTPGALVTFTYLEGLDRPQHRLDIRGEEGKLLYNLDLHGRNQSRDYCCTNRGILVLDGYTRPEIGRVERQGDQWVYQRGIFPDPPPSRSVHSIVAAPDERWIAIAGADGMLVLASQEKSWAKAQSLHRDDAVTLATDSEGRRLACGLLNGGVRVYNTKDWSLVGELPANRNLISALEFSPLGDRLAVARGEHEVLLWEPEKAVRSLVNPPRGTTCFAFSEQGDRLLTGHSDGYASLFDLTDNSPLFYSQVSSSGVSDVAISENGDPLFITFAGVVHLWDLTSLRAQLRSRGLDW